jgi:hypothetical protein
MLLTVAKWATWPFRRLDDTRFLGTVGTRPKKGGSVVDTRSLYGIFSACQMGIQYETQSDQKIRIKKLENVISTAYHRHYRGDCSIGFKNMKMLSLSFLYLERSYGMMMVVRNIGLFRIPKILSW